MAPTFRNGYDKHLDLTEDEYLDQQAERYADLVALDYCTCAQCEGDAKAEAVHPEGEPREDTYFPGIADYDVFGRPAWGDDDAF